MRTREEIEREMERIEPYTYISNGDSYEAHASDYEMANYYLDLQNTLKACLKSENPKEWLNHIKESIRQIKEQCADGTISGYERNQAMLECKAVEQGIDFIESESTLVQELRNENEKIINNIKKLQRKLKRNKQKIKSMRNYEQL